MTGQVKYTYRPEYCLPLPIPLDAAVNQSEVAAWKQKILESNNKE